MAEWSKAHAWKVCRRGTVSRVRIPLSPPFIQANSLKIGVFCTWNSGEVHLEHELTVALMQAAGTSDHQGCTTSRTVLRPFRTLEWCRQSPKSGYCGGSLDRREWGGKGSVGAQEASGRKRPVLALHVTNGLYLNALPDRAIGCLKAANQDGSKRAIGMFVSQNQTHSASAADGLKAAEAAARSIPPAFSLEGTAFNVLCGQAGLRRAMGGTRTVGLAAPRPAGARLWSSEQGMPNKAPTSPTD